MLHEFQETMGDLWADGWFSRTLIVLLAAIFLVFFLGVGALIFDEASGRAEARRQWYAAHTYICGEHVDDESYVVTVVNVGKNNSVPIYGSREVMVPTYCWRPTPEAGS